MSTDTYKQCLENEYQQDREAVEFIIHIYELGGKAALEDAKRLWDAMPAKVLAVITFLGGLGAKDQAKKAITDLLKKNWTSLAGLLGATIAGLGVAAVGLALIAGVSCLPKLDD
ncbi:MAG: hypothetical protein ACJ72N_09850 [Labedaea sp.]